MKIEATGDYQSKAYIVGRAWWDTKERSLNPQCFAKFAAKGSDFTIYNTPNQAAKSKWYKGHNAGNF